MKRIVLLTLIVAIAIICAAQALMPAPAPEKPVAEPKTESAFQVKKYTYEYYPEAEIYYQVETENWFCRDGKFWILTKEFPFSALMQTNGEKVTFQLCGKNPVLYHNEVKKKFCSNAAR